MYTIIVLVFVIGYFFIATENIVKINKTASAILTGVLCWVLYIFMQTDTNTVTGQLMEHLGDISSILFFLMSAMTIVELIDAHNGFEVITKLISTTNKRKLLWITAILAFFLSAMLDNLTTTIVFITLLRKLVPEKKDRLIFASMIVIAANAGGAWTPIGDVTTTMLWIGNRLTTSTIISRLFLPSIISLIIPLFLVSLTIKGNVMVKQEKKNPNISDANGLEQKIILFLGLGALLFVPIFKEITNLPPFMGILFGVGILWLVTELMHRKKEEEVKHHFSVNSALKRMDMPSVLFFLGILLAIAALQAAGHLTQLSVFLDKNLHNLNLISVSMGLLSAIIDNVPMVAATMGMYPLSQYPTDHSLWEMLAYCVGTGGSVLIIGSAAGVAAMGLEKIDFFWYMKKISLYALIGYFAGVGIYLLEEAFLKF
jgi:Na+/H+ antiporter NhaD/arsenite permease-like protein